MRACMTSSVPWPSPALSLIAHEKASTEVADASYIAKTAENIGNESDCQDVLEANTKLPGQDSNLDKENQNLLCYRYTTG